METSNGNIRRNDVSKTMCQVIQSLFMFFFSVVVHACQAGCLDGWLRYAIHTRSLIIYVKECMCVCCACVVVRCTRIRAAAALATPSMKMNQKREKIAVHT